ncbi:MAG: aldo/keto reductase [Christensenellales bacterium]|jgi:L-glyceraldehyde 3-phosphate reductase|nr:L-glyceraldehyde 3-phosphate reductase [Clostridiales bacterium]
MYTANKQRYETMEYKRVGKSGLKLPYVSLGLWHNFGSLFPHANSREMILGAFDLGITHFDLANNYGPVPGSAEETFGRVLAQDLRKYRDEIIISTKSGYYMWEGPYGEWGSRKQMIASLDQSLLRMGLDYVDIFYSHRPDLETPLEETVSALVQAVRSGKALYVGLSNYDAKRTKEAIDLLKAEGIHCLIHQPRYNIYDRRPEEGLYQVLEEEGVGAIPFSPLEQGLLTNRYLNGIPADSRAAGGSIFLKSEQITEDKLSQIRKLNDIAVQRGQTLAQMALSWLHKSPVTASVIIGASRLSQIEDCAKAHQAAPFTQEELDKIDQIVKG